MHFIDIWINITFQDTAITQAAILIYKKYNRLYIIKV